MKRDLVLFSIVDRRQPWQIKLTKRELEAGRQRATQARAENDRLMREFQARMGQKVPP